jgi:hypothetical protein
MVFALENQKYYLAQAKSVGKLWFQVPKHPHQYSEFVLVNPDMARDLMSCNLNIRSIQKRTVAAYTHDLKNGLWLQTDESISIDVAGNMGNGQHRTEAIIQADVTVPMYITWNVPIESRFVQDSGAKRTVNEKLRLIIDTNLGNRGAALCRAMMSGINSRVKFSESQIAQFAIKHERAINWVTHHLPGVRADVQAVIAKAYLWHGEEAMLPFCERFHKVVFQSENDPAGLLYKWLMRVKVSGHNTSGTEVYKKTLAAVDHYISGRTVKNLYERDEDVFEWKADWEVPSKA